MITAGNAVAAANMGSAAGVFVTSATTGFTLTLTAAGAESPTFQYHVIGFQ
jgi:hypothetical protein